MVCIWLHDKQRKPLRKLPRQADSVEVDLLFTELMLGTLLEAGFRAPR